MMSWRLQLSLTVINENANAFDWYYFQKKYIEWEVWGLIALITPLAAFVMMTLKIPN
jgi:hypothetical protein